MLLHGRSALNDIGNLELIVLSEDGKTFCEIESLDDFAERPGFQWRIDLNSFEFKDIIAQYNEPNEAHCGIKSCHHWDKKGFGVVGTNGVETIIGKDCGKKYLAVSTAQPLQISANTQ